MQGEQGDNLVYNDEELRLMIKIAHMYYEEDMTQSQIAKELNINRTAISRTLKKMREEGTVKISINYNLSKTFQIEQELVKRFRLKEAIVVPCEKGQSSQTKLRSLGRGAAQLLNRIIEDNDVVGFSWGSSLAATIDELVTTKEQDVLFVPLIGGPSGKLESKYHVNTIVYNAAQLFNGKSKLIDFPALVEKKKTAEDIKQSIYFQEILKLWDKVTIALVGIGSPALSGSSTWGGFYGEEFCEELESANVAGDICSHFYNLNGEQVPTSISERTISIDLDHLKEMRYSVGIAESPEKVSAIIGALNGRYLNVLVTTEETAELILKKSVQLT
ncbi:sugar-binding transcriptional regulator [Ectobacillus funiculus]|uniref:sugar-binding transcriptional regulator n=1 Tax=Ectobacillus funiculus TaxID=137993 RepID=UPI0039781827